MKTILFLIPLALLLGGAWLGTFLWSLRSGQYEDLEGAGMRILMDDDGPLKDEKVETDEGKAPDEENKQD